MYWGGKEADVDALFREYCRLFYGPAEREMLAFFEFCEANWSAMGEGQNPGRRSLARFDAAKAKAPADSVFSQRIALIDDYLDGLRRKSVQLGQKRGLVPTVRLVGDAEGIVIDGKLDDAYGQKTPVSATGSFRELQTGRIPTHATTFKAGWQAGSVCFAIRCEEPDARPNIGTTKEDDSALWYGDCIEILLETEARSYYQIAVAPSGAVADLDRSAPREAWYGWDSQAEVATHTGDGFWTVEIRIPVTRTKRPAPPGHRQQADPEPALACQPLPPADPRGRHRTQRLFAHRRREFPRSDEVRALLDGRSHTFEASELKGDSSPTSAPRRSWRVPANTRSDRRVPRPRRRKDPRNRPHRGTAIRRPRAGRASARALRDFAKAEEIAARIPVERCAKTARLQSLLDQYQSSVVVVEFKDEDFAAWPYLKRGEGLLLRGRARAVMKDGEGAVADYTRSLPLLGDPRMRQSLNLALGQARELLLHDDTAALAAYRAVYGDAATVGGADELGAVQGVARVLTRQQQTDEALAEWRGSTPEKSAERGAIPPSSPAPKAHAAAGRKAEAVALCREVLVTRPPRSGTTRPRRRRCGNGSEPVSRPRREPTAPR